MLAVRRFPLRRHWPAVVVVVAMLVWAGVFSWWTVGKELNFTDGWYDLGIMTQTVWRTAHGLGFTFSNPEAGAGGLHGLIAPRTSIHADYLLLLLTPLGWFAHLAESLLLVQVLVVAAGAWFVFRLGQRLLHSDVLGMFLAVVYLMYPPLAYPVLFDFHAVTLATTFFLAAADAAVAKRWGWFWVWAGLALISKEQAGITLGLLGFVLWWRNGQHRRAWTVLGVAWGWVALQLGLVIPLSRPGQAATFALKFYGQTADTATGVAHTLFQPSVLWSRLMTATHLHDLVQLFQPLGLFIPFLGPIFLLAIPEALIYWLSDSPNQQVMYLHYHALFIPFMFLGLLFGWRAWRRLAERWWPGHRVIVDVLLVLLVLVGSTRALLRDSAWPWSPLTRWTDVTWKERAANDIHQALAMIPARAAVATTQNLGPQVAARPVVQLLPTGVATADDILILQRNYDPKIPTNDKRLAEKVMVERLVAWLDQSSAYHQLYHQGRVWLYQRTGTDPRPLPSWPSPLLGQ